VHLSALLLECDLLHSVEIAQHIAPFVLLAGGLGCGGDEAAVRRIVDQATELMLAR
jgi:hypothetical protein